MHLLPILVLIFTVASEISRMNSTHTATVKPSKAQNEIFQLSLKRRHMPSVLRTESQPFEKRSSAYGISLAQSAHSWQQSLKRRHMPSILRTDSQPFEKRSSAYGISSALNMSISGQESRKATYDPNATEDQEPQDLEQTHQRQKRSIDSLKDTYSISIIGNVFVPRNIHQFVKTIEFSQIYNQLFNLLLDITSLDPDFSSSQFTPVTGVTTIFYLTNHLRTPAANSIKCAELSGNQITLNTFISERLTPSKPIALADVVNVHANSVSCDINEKSYQDIQCVKTLISLSNTWGYTLTDKTPTIYYQELLQNHSNTALYLTIENRNWSLDPALHSSTICSAGASGSEGQQDAFTITIKRKFFRTTANLLTTIVQTMQESVTGLQALFLLHIETNSPITSSSKPAASLCQAIKKMQMVHMPTSLNKKKTALSTFIEEIMPNSLIINTALTILENKANELCADNKNQPLINKMYNGYVTMTMNLKTYLTSYVQKVNPNSVFSLPSQLPFLLTAQVTEQDVKSTYFNIMRAPLDQDEIKIITLLVENEKTNLIHYLRQFLPQANPLPQRHTILKFLVKDS